MSSLAWARSDRTNSILVRRVNIVFTTISMYVHAQLADTEHIPGSMNIVFNGLSRNVSPVQLGLDPTLLYSTAADSTINEFIKLCNPAIPLTDMLSHM